MAGTRRYSKPVDGPMVSAEKSALAEAIDAYEAVRLTPGPERAAAMAAIKPLLLPFGVYAHRGCVYHWSREEDCLYRHLSRVTWGKPLPGARDFIIMRRRGVTIGNDGDGDNGRRRNLWQRTNGRGRAL